MMSRLVQAEIDQRRTTPWAGFHDLFASASLVGGNFEGALGDPANCSAENKLCFAAPRRRRRIVASTPASSFLTAENKPLRRPRPRGP